MFAGIWPFRGTRDIFKFPVMTAGWPRGEHSPLAAASLSGLSGPAPWPWAHGSSGAKVLGHFLFAPTP